MSHDDLRHLQWGELAQALEKFLAGDDGAVLTIYEPISGNECGFSRYCTRIKQHRFDSAGEESLRMPVLNFTFKDADRLAGFAAHWLIHVEPDPRGFFACTAIVTDRYHGMFLCFAVMNQLFDLPEDRWLFITDIEQQDWWPDPLPKPEPWPPNRT